MNWKNTIDNIKGCYTKRHLKDYPRKEKFKIIFLITWIAIKAFVIAFCNSLIRREPPKTVFQNEQIIFKAWVCLVYAREIMKPINNTETKNPTIGKHTFKF